MKSLGLFKKALWEKGCGVLRLSSRLCGGMIAKTVDKVGRTRIITLALLRDLLRNIMKGRRDFRNSSIFKVGMEAKLA